MRLALFDAWRAILMLQVAGAHYGPYHFYPGADLVVGVFFALSFCLLTHAAATPAFLESHQVRISFVFKRLARLLPMYYVVLAAHMFYWHAACADMTWDINGVPVYSWYPYAGGYMRRTLPRPAMAVLDWLCASCWVGAGLDGEPMQLWMVSSLVWVNILLPWAIIYEHASLSIYMVKADTSPRAEPIASTTARLKSIAKVDGPMGLSVLVRYVIACYVWPWVIAVPFYIAFRPLPPQPANAAPVCQLYGEPACHLMPAVFAAREVPITRLPAMLLNVRTTLAISHSGWRPSPSLRNLTLSIAAVLYVASCFQRTTLAPLLTLLLGPTGAASAPAWRFYEYISQPVFALAVPFLLSLHLDAHPLVVAAANTYPATVLTTASTYGLAFYYTQPGAMAAAIWLLEGRLQCSTAGLRGDWSRAGVTFLINATFAVIAERFVIAPSYAVLRNVADAPVARVSSPLL